MQISLQIIMLFHTPTLSLKGKKMKNERILSYTMSQKLSEEDLKSISAAGTTASGTANGTYNHNTGYDTSIDMTVDF